MRYKLPILLAALLCFIAARLGAETFVDGAVSGIWDTDGSPYIAVEDIDVPDGRVLRIEPGVEVRFAPRVRFYVHGLLQAIGSEGDSIVFHAAQAGDVWGGIRADEPDSLFRLDYCIIRDGFVQVEEDEGSPANSGGNLFLHRGNSLIEHSRISNGFANGFGGGVAVWAGQARLNECLFNENFTNTQGGGLNVRNHAQVDISKCEFTGNQAGWGGGGVNIEEGSVVEIVDCRFAQNQAATGGGVALYGNSLTCTHSTFERNSANMGGAAYVRNEGNTARFEWCDFLENRTQGEGGGGAILLRFAIEAEIVYCRFIENTTNALGGAINIHGEYRSNIHHCLFIRNQAGHVGGVIATPEDMGDRMLEMPNCTMIDNISFGEEGVASIGFIRNGSRALFSSCILWGGGTHFWNPDNVIVSYSHSDQEHPGEGNIVQNPGLFELDSTWCLLKGNSPCVDSGNRNLPVDPDESVNDRGWMHFPHDAWDSDWSDTLSARVDPGERSPARARFRNDTGVPVFVTVLDKWRDGDREAMINATALTGDSDIRCATWTNDRFVVAGGNNRQDPNKVYIIDRDENLREQFNQPGGVDGDGFLDLTGDGGEVVFAGDEEQIVEFTIDGELGEQYEGPDALRAHRAIAVDFQYAEGFYEFYIGGDEGYIVRTDDEFWEIEDTRIVVGDTIRSLGIKGNSQALYMVTEPSPGVAILSLVTPEERQVFPLYRMTPPLENVRLGGVEVTQDWRGERGSLVGVWQGTGDGNDWLFVSDLYTTWLVVLPEWKLLMPGEETEWGVEFAGDMVGEGNYESEFFLAVNGYGEGGEGVALLRVGGEESVEGNSSGTPTRFGILAAYPNPFNDRLTVRFTPLSTGNAFLTVYDALGRKVGKVTQLVEHRGVAMITWNAANSPAGVYFLTVRQRERHTSPRSVFLVK